MSADDASEEDSSGRAARVTLKEELGKRDAFELPEQEVYLNLLRTAEHLGAPFDALFKAHGLSQTQYNALRIMRGHGEPIASSTVARQMVTREPDITRLLDRLVKRGLVTRQRSDADRRVMLTSLTSEGEGLLAEMDGPVRELHERQLAHMSREELRTLSGLLERAREERGGA